MQIRCSNCHRPYGLNRDQVHTALDMLEAEEMGHYNTTCPHCRRVNRVSRDELLRAAPDWARQSQESDLLDEESVTPKEQVE